MREDFRRNQNYKKNLNFFFEFMRTRGIEVLKKYFADKTTTQSICQGGQKEGGPVFTETNL